VSSVRAWLVRLVFWRQPMTMTGTVTAWRHRAPYGWVTADGATAETFCHRRDCPDSRPAHGRQGRLLPARSGPTGRVKAVNVQLIENKGVIP